VKKLKNKKYIEYSAITIAGVLILALFLISVYSQKINFAGSFKVTDPFKTGNKIHLTTPLNHNYTNNSSCFSGYFKELKVESLPDQPKVIQTFMGKEINLRFKKQNDSLYVALPVLTNYSQKLSAFFIINRNMIYIIGRSCMLMLFFILIVYFLILKMIGNSEFLKNSIILFYRKSVNCIYRNRIKGNHLNSLRFFFRFHIKNIIKHKVCSFFQPLRDFIVKFHLRIFIPCFLAILPGGIYILFDPNVINFLNISIWQGLLWSMVIFYIPVFLICFGKPLKLNVYFWVSFILIFILYYFVFFPGRYIYGDYFRDDISKFFVKAYQYHFYQMITMPDSNYMNVFQNLMAYIILKVLSIRNYFPEALQFSTLLSITFLYTSFNLRIFKTLCDNDLYRFIIGIAASVLVLFFDQIQFLFDVPFLAALVFWPVLFLNYQKIPKIKAIVLTCIFVIFIFSKPIFTVYLLILIMMLLISKMNRQKPYIHLSLIFITAILIHLVINYISTKNSIIVQPLQGDLGTHYMSSFRVEGIAFWKALIYGLYIFIRAGVGMFFSFSVTPSWVNIIINILFFITMIIVNSWLVIKWIAQKQKIHLFLISGTILAFLSCVLFVKTVSVHVFIIESENVLNYSFIQALRSNYIPPVHRYLILVYFPVLVVIAYFIINKVRKILVLSGNLTMIFFISLLVLRIGVFFSNNHVKVLSPTKSLWRQYSALIFNYPDNYYMPYYGYPLESECIKNGLERIIDVNTSENGVIYFDSLKYNTELWQVIQVITEYDQKVSDDIYGMECVTGDHKKQFFRPLYPLDSNHRFVVFRFADFMKLKEMKFVDINKNALFLRQPFRLIGKY